MPEPCNRSFGGSDAYRSNVPMKVFAGNAPVVYAEDEPKHRRGKPEMTDCNKRCSEAMQRCMSSDPDSAACNADLSMACDCWNGS